MPDLTHTQFTHALNRLFATVKRPGGGRHSNADVARATGLSKTLVGHLRSGVRPNPTLDTVTKLAAFFGVPASALVDPAQHTDETPSDELDARLRVAAALRNPSIRALALRADATELSDEGIAAVAAMLEHVAQAEAASANRGNRRDHTAPPRTGHVTTPKIKDVWPIRDSNLPGS